MLWRPPPIIRSFIALNYRRYSSIQAVGPLKILFCGSDEFSIASLRALNDAKIEQPQLIESINVAHRPGKRTGRGLKVIKDVPIKHVAAQELKLETHEIDTFTGWKPPIPFDLIIAVSFGLFVPPRILSGMRHGGLNVHPSLLPDLRGPAPIHHTLLKGRSHTGVTIQTLHPKHFDHGTILAQTQPPGLHLGSVAGLTLAKLTTVLGEEGAKMLLHVIRARKFINPRVDAGWYAESGGPVGHAEKITKQYTYVDLALATAQDIQVRHNVLGDLWSHLPNGERIILDDVKLITPDRDTRQAPGFFIDEEDRLKLRTSSGGVLLINRCTLPGGKRGGANEPVKRILSAV